MSMIIVLLVRLRAMVPMLASDSTLQLRSRVFCVLAAGVSVIAVGACGVGSRSSTPLAARSQVTIAVRGTGSGSRLPAGFIGLGLEANTLARHEFPRTNLADYLRILDPHGMLRIGGNSVESFWTSTNEPVPAWSHGEVTPASLRGLAQTMRGTGWRVILGVPFKHSTPARAADEAKYAEQILGPVLRAIEIGNEPNRYGITQSVWFAEFERYARAIRSAVPGVAIAGPAEGRNAPSWVSAFAHDESQHPDVSLLTAHEYPLSICSGQHPTIAQLLSTEAEGHETAAADTLVTAARSLNVPAVMDETNSVVCWGAPGVSDTYASALWILDYGLLMAQHGVAAANFQTRISGCTPYLPLCTRTHSSQLFARPEFYGLLALAQVGAGRFLDVSNPTAGTLRAFAVENRPGRLSIILDNLGAATTVKLLLPGSGFTGARQTTLATGSRAGLRATTEITLGGRAVGADGQVGQPTYTRAPVAGSTATVPLAAHTAVIVKLS